MSEARPRIAAIVLAAGRSTRMAAANKLLADIGGRAMVRHVAQAAAASLAAPVIVVTGHMGDEVADAVAGLDLTLAPNPDYATGLSSSLKAGIRALPNGCDGALILLGDMPRIEPEHINRIIAAFGSEGRAPIVVPIRQGRQGNPVLWPAGLFGELLQLEGDAGAKKLIATYKARIAEIDLGTDAIFIDVDTPQALAQMRSS